MSDRIPIFVCGYKESKDATMNNNIGFIGPGTIVMRDAIVLATVYLFWGNSLSLSYNVGSNPAFV